MQSGLRCSTSPGRLGYRGWSRTYTILIYIVSWRFVTYSTRLVLHSGPFIAEDNSNVYHPSFIRSCIHCDILRVMNLRVHVTSTHIRMQTKPSQLKQISNSVEYEPLTKHTPPTSQPHRARHPLVHAFVTPFLASFPPACPSARATILPEANSDFTHRTQPHAYPEQSAALTRQTMDMHTYWHTCVLHSCRRDAWLGRG